MSATDKKPSKIVAVTGVASSQIRNDVEERSEILSDQEKRRKSIMESSGRIARPSTAEVRHEVMRLSKETGLSEFERGVATALEWILGDRKTLRRSDK